MVKTEWVDIVINDKVDDTAIIYNQEKLEEITEDKFEAVKYNENGKPEVWFTNNFVCYIDTYHAWTDRLIILPRDY